MSIPVLCTGGFQTASVISAAIERGDCDGVTIARPLVANPDLVRHFEQGLDPAPRPCTYCNKCLFAFVENPLGCYEERRYDSREQMIDEIFSVYAEAAMSEHAAIFEPLRSPPSRSRTASSARASPAASTTTTAWARRST